MTSELLDAIDAVEDGDARHKLIAELRAAELEPHDHDTLDDAAADCAGIRWILFQFRQMLDCSLRPLPEDHDEFVRTGTTPRKRKAVPK